MNKLYKKIPQEYTPIVVMVILQIIMHIFMGFCTAGDDVLLQEHLKDESLFEFTIQFYKTWSSRVFINGIAVIIGALPVLVWKILDIFLVSLIPYTCVELIECTNKTKCSVVAVCMTLLYPLSHQHSAGWVGTTISYLWPFSFALYGFLLLKKALLGQELKSYQIILGIIAQILACNAEQVSVVYTVITFAVLIYVLMQKKQKIIPMLMFAISVLSVIFNITCPGNSLRTVEAIRQCDPDFKMLTLIEKLQLGFSETMSMFLFAPNFIYLVFCIMLFVVVWNKRSDLASKVVVITPLLVVILIGFLGEFTSNVVQNVELFAPMSAEAYFSSEVYGGLININNFNSITSYIPTFVMVVCMIMNMIAIYISIDNVYSAILTVLVYCCSIGSGMIMGFSPTLYASISRPYTLSFFAIILVILMVYGRSNIMFEKNISSKIVKTLIIVASVYYVFQLIYVIDFYEQLVKIY